MTDITDDANIGSKETGEKIERPTREDAEKAVETLIRWAGDNPGREGLRDTPRRVVKSYGEFFKGYDMCPKDILGTSFEEFGEYNDFVLVKNIDFSSHCEHHMVPIIGKAHVAYWPQGRVTGISKLARVVDAYGKRLTMQEKMTRQIAGAIESVLKPKGVAVMIDAVHHCMTTRGVAKCASSTVTSAFTGVFERDQSVRDRFFWQIKG
jgi:GTP cyclohydrolase I